MSIRPVSQLPIRTEAELLAERDQQVARRNQTMGARRRLYQDRIFEIDNQLLVLRRGG